MEGNKMEKAGNIVALPQRSREEQNQCDALRQFGEVLDRGGVSLSTEFILALHRLLTAAQLASARRQGLEP
jgi:hypothetical protein